MRTLKAAQSNHFFSASVAVAAAAAAEAGREEPDTEEQRRFRALFDEASPPEDSPCARPGKRHDQCCDVVSSASRTDCGEPINCENNFDSPAPSRRFDIDALKVRLTNGPLAGSEVEAYRCGDQVSVRIRAAGSTPLQGIERPSAAKLAAELSKRLGLPVSVEYHDAPAAAT